MTEEPIQLCAGWPMSSLIGFGAMKYSPYRANNRDEGRQSPFLIESGSSRGYDGGAWGSNWEMSVNNQSDRASATEGIS